MNASPKKLHIKSYGCQMNVYDAQRMVDALARENYVETADADDADLVILNTCHIREKASEKVYSELGRLRESKDAATEDGRAMKIVVAGCVAMTSCEAAAGTTSNAMVFTSVNPAVWRPKV